MSISSSRNPATTLPPGFRFYPTDEELIIHYLRKRIAGSPCPVSIIAEVDIYKFDPWDLPAKSTFGEREWYFFSPRDRKYPNGVRPNRAAASGYWKATGTDKAIVAGEGKENIGAKKALVFYKGRPPKGIKTEWIMHEYRLAGAQTNNNGYRPKLTDSSMRLDDWVLCRIYKKSSHHSSTADGELPEDSSGVEDHVFMATPRKTTTTTTTQEINSTSSFLNLHKSCSLTELFEAVDCSAISRLLDTPPNILVGLENPAAMPNPTFLQPLLSYNDISYYNNENNYLVQSSPLRATDQLTVPESSLKSLRPGDCSYDGGDAGGDHLLRQAKRPVDHQLHQQQV